jgi:transcriptional regulator with XRE-family HTH domain
VRDVASGATSPRVDARGFGQRLGYSAAAISRIERGQRIPRPRIVPLLADALGLDQATKTRLVGTMKRAAPASLWQRRRWANERGRDCGGRQGRGADFSGSLGRSRARTLNAAINPRAGLESQA